MAMTSRSARYSLAAVLAAALVVVAIVGYVAARVCNIPMLDTLSDIATYVAVAGVLGAVIFRARRA